MDKKPKKLENLQQEGDMTRCMKRSSSYPRNQGKEEI